jgi:SNF2 family DNA or RNA helicase
VLYPAETKKVELPPLMEHQKQGIESLLKNKCFALFDSPGIGKSRQVIEAANILFSKCELELVLIICPAMCKFIWMDPELGEIKRWSSTSKLLVHDFGAKDQWGSGSGDGSPGATYFICSYEWLRSVQHSHEVCLMLEKRRYMLVLDESSFLRNRTTKQWKACLGPRYGRVKIKNKWKQLSNKATRTVILNGTPIANHVLDLWGQFYMLDKNILDQTYWEFRATHAIIGGWMNKEIVGYRDLDGSAVPKNQAPPKLMAQLEPWILCRQKRDVLDLPSMTRSVRAVFLDERTWGYYKQMRADFLIEINRKEFTAANAAVKAMRLAQITSGFISSEEAPGTLLRQVKPHYLPTQPKLDWLLDWLKENDSNEPIIIWCWWRAQLNNLERRLENFYDVYTLHGGTATADKRNSLLRFNPGWNTRLDRRRAILLAQPAAGGMGLNLSAASTNIHLSGSHSFISREQADGRIERPGQVNPMHIIDVIATGPKGQKTIDEVILKGRERKEELSSWTKERWKKEL